MRRMFTALAALVLVGGLVAACGDDDEGETTVNVYAAASLTATFEQMEKDFEERNDGVDIVLSFGGSSDLVTQIQEGAPADVFASADTANMDKLVADGLEGSEPELFASNTLQIVTPPDNPAGVASLQDLTADDLNLVVCAPEVPCGAAAQKVAESAGITLSPVSEEQSVTDVLAKVSSGEADAGLVYVTDVIAAGDDVMGVELPEASSAVNEYPIATTADSENADAAQDFVDYVLGEAGQSTLADAGFAQP